MFDHDSIMVDTDFLIETECQKRKIKLIRPPFMYRKNQLSHSEVSDQHPLLQLEFKQKK